MRPLAILREWVSRLLGTAGPARSDHDLEQELAHHLGLAAERLRSQGHTPAQAERLARIEAGRMTQSMENLREQRAFLPLSAFWLDIKLGARMLRKSWGLTLVGGAAMVMAITMGASVYEFLTSLGGRDLPLPEGDRIVVVQPWNPELRKEMYSSVEDFERWRAELQSVGEIGAFYTLESTLSAEGGSAGIKLAGINAEGLRLTRVAPQLGRLPAADDELPGAPPVVVLSHHIWQSQFFGDLAILGRQVRMDGVFHTVIGVMPEGFVFPYAHDAWTTLQTRPLAGGRPIANGTWDNPDGEPGLIVFARLAEEASLAQADAEAAALGLIHRPSPIVGNAAPGSVAPEVMARAVPYTAGITGNTDQWLLDLIGFMLALLLIPPCANIAILIYARTVSRQGEFATRSAMGASRARIVGQVFLEVLVLALIAAGVSLLLANKLVEQMHANMELRIFGEFPFWMDFSLSYETVIYVTGLALLAALIAGAIPAMRATGGGRMSGLQALGRGSAPKLGKVWTGLVVVQVALSVAALPIASELAWFNLRSATLGPGFAAEDFLAARLVLDDVGPDAPADGSADTRSLAERFGDLRASLLEQLATEAGIAGVAAAGWTPTESPFFRVEMEPSGGQSLEDPGSATALPLTAVNQVSEGFFATFGMTLLAGRGFNAADLEPGERSVIVNRAFAEQILKGDALGRRIRFLAQGPEIPSPQPWWQVVGVVEDRTSNGTGGVMLYRPLPPGGLAPWVEMDPALQAIAPEPNSTNLDSTNTSREAVHLIVRSRAAGIQESTARLRQLAATLDPDLRVDQVRTMQQIHDEHVFADTLGGGGVAGIMACLIGLSIAGVYTLMAFTVTQRYREIGIRAALGASPARLTLGIFRSVFLPVGVGAALGASVALVLNYWSGPLRQAIVGAKVLPGVLPVTELGLLLVAAMAVAGPIRRALNIDPTEALRDG